MNWEVKHDDKSLACQMPANISPDSDVSAKLAGQELRIRWHPVAKRLTVLHALDSGALLEENIYLEQADTQVFNGGAEVDLLYWQGGELKQLQGQVGLAMALHQRQQASVELIQTINSPLTGKIIQVNAIAGQRVKKGELLLVIEAMKMENRIQSPADATVVEVKASVNTAVNVGDTLLKLQQNNK